MQTRIDFVVSWQDKEKNRHTVFTRNLEETLLLKTQLRASGYKVKAQKRTTITCVRKEIKRV